MYVTAHIFAGRLKERLGLRSSYVTLQFVIITQFVINYKLRWIATQFVIHRISNCVVMTTQFVMNYNLRQNFIILKYWKWEKKFDQRQNASLQSYLTVNSVRHQSIRARHAKVPINTTIVQNAILPPLFCENQFVRPSIGLFVRPSVCRKNFNIAYIFWSIKDITLMFGMNDPWKKSFQLAPCRDLCFDLDLLQGQFILPARGQQLSELACKVYIYTVI